MEIEYRDKMTIEIKSEDEDLVSSFKTMFNTVFAGINQSFISRDDTKIKISWESDE